MVEADCPYVSRGGVKLAAALDRFAIDPAGWSCADLGGSIGGFTDCLLQAGAGHVYYLDTAYGDLAWKLRQEPRVTVLERTNALHFDPAAELTDFAGCELVTVDLGWSRQTKAIPAALRWLKNNDASRIITLIKAHYEAPAPTGGSSKSQRPRSKRKGKGKAARPKRPPLTETLAQAIVEQTLADLQAHAVTALDWCRSPITGAKGGNPEYLALLAPER